MWLGLSQNAVRQKVKRGTLRSERDAGVVYVLVADQHDHSRDQPNPTMVAPDQHDQRGTAPSPAPVSATDAGATQLAILRDTLLAPLIAQNERQQAQLLEEREARVRAETERDALQARVVKLEEQQAALLVQTPNEPQRPVRRAWWRLWD